MIFSLWMAYLFTGMISSFLSGLLGIGGGLIIIPALVVIFEHYQIVSPENIMHVAVGTSLASSIINLLSSVMAHHKNGNVRWDVFQQMSPGILVGSLLIGPAIVLVLSNQHLQIIFGIACFFFSVQMLLQKKETQIQEHLPGKTAMILIGLFSGTLSLLLGLAGGVIIGTILNYYAMDMRKIVGTSASLGVILSLSGTIGLIVIGFEQPNLPLYSTGFIYWPALFFITLCSPFFSPLGAKAAQTLPVHVLKKLFAGLVLIIGLKMLI